MKTESPRQIENSPGDQLQADAQTNLPATSPNADAPIASEQLQSELHAANAKIAQLTGENARLETENTSFLAKKEELDEKEIVVRQKMNAGLSRKQAESVWERQLAMHKQFPGKFKHPNSAWDHNPRRS